MRRELAHGALWMLAEVAGGEGISLLAFVILSRLLDPGDYGVVSLAGVVSVFLQVMLTRGFADAVVALPDAEDWVSTAFWANLVLATALFALVQIGADAVARCFGQPLVASVLRWFSFCFFTTALTFIPLAALRRQLRFKTFAVRAAIGSAFGGTVAITMALTGWGIWSLVGAQFGQGVAAVASVWLMGGWRPRFHISAPALRALSRFSGYAMGGAVLDLLASKIDIIAVGLFCDVTSVGYYFLVKRVLQTVSGTALYPAWSVMMPALSRFAGNWAAFNRAYVALVTAAQACWAPIVAGLGAAAPEVVPAVFGPRWEGAVPVFEAASLLAFSRALTSCTSQALGSAGRADAYTALGSLEVGLTALLVVCAAPFGVAKAGLALGVASLLVVPFHLMMLRRCTGLDPRDVLRPLVGIGVASVLMTVCIVLTRAAALPAFLALPMPAIAGLDVALGALVYLLALRLLAPGTFIQIVALSRSVVPRLGRSEPAATAGGG
jgi:O-antigen/teichoic acid export membrane protein